MCIHEQDLARISGYWARINHITTINSLVSDLNVYFYVMSLPVTTPLPGSVPIAIDLLTGHYKY